jgi:hypothetical protein
MAETTTTTRHVERPTRFAGEKPRCVCGQPWPCARDVTDPVIARLGYLRACVEAAQVTPQAFDLSVLLGDFGNTLAALDAVLALATKREHGALRWQDPLPVPEWIPEVRAAIAGALKVSTDGH